MAENSLSSRLQMAMRRLTGRGILSENDIDEMMREVRLSLLEADVNFKVVKAFIANIKEQAVGEKILKGLNPGQQVVKIVHDELKRVMGEDSEGIRYNIGGLTTIMTIGLQGSGKTTAIGKLGVYIKKVEKKKVLFIAADVYRPAAIEQLKTIGKQIDVEVFEKGLIDARTIVKEGLEYARVNGYDVAIIDTAGRLQTKTNLMAELSKMKRVIQKALPNAPQETLLVIDATTGQNGMRQAEVFKEATDVTGIVLTKLDGTAKGGIVLAIRHLYNLPIKYVGLGEKIEDLVMFDIEQYIYGLFKDFF